MNTFHWFSIEILGPRYSTHIWSRSTRYSQASHAWDFGTSCVSLLSSKWCSKAGNLFPSPAFARAPGRQHCKFRPFWSATYLQRSTTTTQDVKFRNVGNQRKDFMGTTHCWADRQSMRCFLQRHSLIPFQGSHANLSDCHERRVTHLGLHWPQAKAVDDRDVINTGAPLESLSWCK